MQNKANLLNAQINVSSVLTKDYENDNAFRFYENKPNQTQFSRLWSAGFLKLTSKPVWPMVVRFRLRLACFNTCAFATAQKPPVFPKSG